MALLARNRKLPPPKPGEVIPLPFDLVVTARDADINYVISPDRSLYKLQFDREFKLVNSLDLLIRLDLKLQLPLTPIKTRAVPCIYYCDADGNTVLAKGSGGPSSTLAVENVGFEEVIGMHTSELIGRQSVVTDYDELEIMDSDLDCDMMSSPFGGGDRKPRIKQDVTWSDGHSGGVPAELWRELLGEPAISVAHRTPLIPIKPERNVEVQYNNAYGYTYEF